MYSYRDQAFEMLQGQGPCKVFMDQATVILEGQGSGLLCEVTGIRLL